MRSFKNKLLNLNDFFVLFILRPGNHFERKKKQIFRIQKYQNIPSDFVPASVKSRLIYKKKLNYNYQLLSIILILQKNNDNNFHTLYISLQSQMKTHI